MCIGALGLVVLEGLGFCSEVHGVGRNEGSRARNPQLNYHIRNMGVAVWGDLAVWGPINVSIVWLNPLCIISNIYRAASN